MAFENQGSQDSSSLTQASEESEDGANVETPETIALKLELSTLTTSHTSMQSTLQLLQTQLQDLTRVNKELQVSRSYYNDHLFILTGVVCTHRKRMKATTPFYSSEPCLVSSTSVEVRLLQPSTKIAMETAQVFMVLPAWLH